MSEDKSDTPNGDAAEKWIKNKNNPGLESEEATTEQVDWKTEEAKRLFKIGDRITQIASSLTSKFSQQFQEGDILIDAERGNWEVIMDFFNKENSRGGFSVGRGEVVQIVFGPLLSRRWEAEEILGHVPAYMLQLHSTPSDGADQSFFDEYYFTEDGRLLKEIDSEPEVEQPVLTQEISKGEMEVVMAAAILLRTRLENIAQAKSIE